MPNAAPLQFNQQHLGRTIQFLFPDKHIITNSRKGVRIPSPDSNLYLELDFWIPDLNLAFEYQDPHHYVTTPYNYTSVASTQKRDDLKLKIAKEKDVSLVVVPCWWDGKLESLVASIHRIRPDIIPRFDKKGSHPISDEVPSNYFKVLQVPDVGELMLASLSENQAFDPSHWWLSEKYDGLRACYHPLRQDLYTRNGRLMHVPPTIFQLFPPSFIEGEMWFGRGSYLEAQKMHIGANSGEIEQGNEYSKLVMWEYMRLVVIDCVDKELKELPFEERFGELLKILDEAPPTLIVAPSFKCPSAKGLRKSLQVVLDDGGEGVIVREPKSSYFHGRSDSLIKFKTHRDQEGLVVGIEHTDVTIRLANGQIFTTKLPETTQLDNEPIIPSVGDIVTFKYSKISPFGQPWQASIDRIRKDLLWDDVLRSSHETRKRSADDCFELPGARNLPAGYWTEDGAKNTKAFFDNFAKKRGKDPQDPETWYKVTYKDIFTNWRDMSVMRHNGGSLRTALMKVYPNIGLDISKFHMVSQGFWIDVNNRRKFVENLSRKRGFPPRSVVHWQGVTPKSLFHEKGGSAIFAHYNGSIADMLRDIYPDLPIDDSKFIGVNSENKWRSAIHRRNFMDEFAAQKGFDPLNPNNWYNVKAEEIVAAQGGTLLNFFAKSVTSLILSVYPDIGLNESRFQIMRKGYWGDANIKRFLDEFGRNNEFDPLIADNWYSVTGKQIRRLKGGWSVLGDEHIAEVIKRIYPNIGIDINHFDYQNKEKYWDKQENRKAFMDNFATLRGGDPHSEEFWCSVTQEELLAEKGGKQVLSRFNLSIKNVLKDAYPTIKWTSSKFIRADKSYWSHSNHQRQALDNIATRHGFDPLLAEHWYAFPKSILKKEKAMLAMMMYHNKSIRATIVANYPELNLERDLFRKMNTKHWKNKANQKALLDQFAKARNFDPLVPAAWEPYSNPVPQELMQITRYKKPLGTILAEVYPVPITNTVQRVQNAD